MLLPPCSTDNDDDFTVHLEPNSEWDRIADPSQRENLGIIVQYKVKVKLCITPLGG